VDDPIDNLTLERLEDDGSIARDKLGLAVARDDHALAYVRDGYDSDDEAELARAGALDVGIELRLEVLLHARSEVGRVQHDRVRELFLQRENWNAWSGGWACTREGEESYDEEHRVWVLVVVVVVGSRARVARSTEVSQVTRDITLGHFSVVLRYPLLSSLYAYRCLCFRVLRQEQPDVTASMGYDPGPSTHPAVKYYHHALHLPPRPFAIMHRSHREDRAQGEAGDFQV
jgi:hypothetical protein